ncbi:unnamed protein product, partial [Meganyctiphanes norvegica]
RRPTVVRLGEVDFEDFDDGTAFDFPIDDITVHPGYNHFEKYNDIAIITLRHRIKFGEIESQPFCLPDRGLNLFDGRRCTFSGWGRRQANAPASTILHQIEVEIVDSGVCGNNYVRDGANLPLFTTQYPRGIDATIICAGRIADSCRGDSGGPLLLRDDETGNKPWNIGIVSSGYGCGDANFPGLYTKVDQYLDWIREQTDGRC